MSPLKKGSIFVRIHVYTYLCTRGLMHRLLYLEASVLWNLSVWAIKSSAGAKLIRQ